MCPDLFFQNFPLFVKCKLEVFFNFRLTISSRPMYYSVCFVRFITKTWKFSPLFGSIILSHIFSDVHIQAELFIFLLLKNKLIIEKSETAKW